MKSILKGSLPIILCLLIIPILSHLTIANSSSIQYSRSYLLSSHTECEDYQGLTSWELRTDMKRTNIIRNEAEDKDKLIIAHRGASAYEIENTLQSFQKAIELKADMIELDIRKTKDNILIAFHDNNITGSQIKDKNDQKIQKTTKLHVPTLNEQPRYPK